MELFELFKDLAGAFGPSGCEKGVAQRIAELVAPYADEVTTDIMGNLIVHKKGPGKKLLFAAHMDSIGILVTHIEQEGFVRFGNLGGLSLRNLVGQSVVFANGVRGVIALTGDKLGEKDVSLSDLYLDIGAKDREEALSMVKPGDAAVYDAPTYLQGGKIYSKYIDNRSGCAVLIAALAQIREAKNDLYFVFTAQEEVGIRGAKTSVYGVDPDVGIAVDITGSDDVPGATHTCSSVLGKGPGIKVMDSVVICQPQVVKWMNDVAQSAGVAVQQDIMRGGGTDAGAILTTRGGVYAGGICIPCRYGHAPVAVCDLGDLENCVRLTVALAESEIAL